MDHSLWIIYSSQTSLTRTNINKPDFDISSIPVQNIDQTEQYLNKQGINRFIRGEADYHYKCLSIPSKPHILYYQGNIDLLNKAILGIVGPRIPSEYGKKVVSQLLSYAKDFDLVTISGLADGIDSLCYQWSIENNIPTIAVLGWGFHYFIRNRSQELQAIVGNWGLIISEFQLGYKPTNYSFPQRNRIIAGLSDYLFVPEASEKSGSLITVDFAIKAHKPIFATPNDIYNLHSTGVNKYISEHKIQAIYHIPHFIESYFHKKNDNIKKKSEKIYTQDLDTAESLIINSLEEKSSSVEQLLTKTGLSISLLSSYLSILELKWLIKQPSNGIYDIIR